ncbi:hypothetical protein [Pedobacter yonginense]|uniref:hypothetical protein n=1 Tax=Pedobacter yonginense TaxID=651869 RepID=UPI001401C600|nr:hypothetical protein [Pedobacter yonginense]
MKNLELENFGVQEMNAKEMQIANGGAGGGMIKKVLGYIGGAISDCAHGFVEGFLEGTR